ncbi:MULTISPECIES: hypothetical protein [unclassified Isoptericola]|uniref:hypothetical protein n=1 Tax=unclassified Isoptericola TaxID=2623355 RepID=UPI002713EC1E|nr:MULTISPECIES: hypothetical protein [unclassified Isoptericola]MDO8143826.1 hypothetical protein [Isoptericola sp. 178]MDO8149977.1 hypothetical protein [Isoptericola sp. b408]
MSEQRSAARGETHGVLRLWTPAPEGDRVRFAPDPDDRYAVVDDLEAEHVILVLDRWPQVDGVGHLVFTEHPQVRSFRVSTFQQHVDARRAQAGQPAPGRALRVGDVFWVRAGDDPRWNDPRRWQLLDVTASARRAAHAAQVVAVNPAMRLREADVAHESSGPPSPEGPRRPPAGAAASTV